MGRLIITCDCLIGHDLEFVLERIQTKRAELAKHDRDQILLRIDKEVCIGAAVPTIKTYRTGKFGFG